MKRLRKTICLLIALILLVCVPFAHAIDPDIKPPLWAIDPGVVAYNAQRMWLPMPKSLWALWPGGDTLYDLSGNSENPTMSSAHSWVADYLSFPGGNDNIPLTDSFLGISGNVTVFVVANVNSSSANAERQLFSGRSDSSGTPIIMQLDTTPDGYVRLIERDDASNTANATGSTNYTDDEWHAFCGVRDGNKRMVYVDGDEKANATTSLGATTALEFRLGGYAILDAPFEYGFLGGMKILIVWLHALTPAQVAILSADPYGLVRPIPLTAWLGGAIAPPAAAKQPILKDTDPHSIIFGGQILSKYMYPDDYFRTYSKPFLKTGTDN